MAEAETEILVENKAGKWSSYGNNYFILKTNLNGVKIEFDGLMQDLPQVSFSTDWEETPQAEIGNKLNEMLNNDMLQFIAQKNGVNENGKMQPMDAMTSRMYKNYTPPKFDLKFRCYPGQKIGAYMLRNADEWKAFLSLTTPANAKCGFSIGNFAEQISGAANGVANFFRSLTTSDDKSTDVDMKTRQANATIKENESRPVDDKSKEAVETLQAAIDANQKLEMYSSSRALAVNQQAYGANLFQLFIYPFIFSQPLTVYINSWSVTASREWNMDMNDHYYYDFTINCSMDQKPCSETWRTMMRGAD